MPNNFETFENQTTLNFSTLLGPRFKTIGFSNQAQAYVKCLTAKCSQLTGHPPFETPMEE